MKKYIIDNVAIVISGLALVVSVLSFYISKESKELAREANEISVEVFNEQQRPYLTFEPDKDEEGNYFQIEPRDNLIEVFINFKFENIGKRGAEITSTTINNSAIILYGNNRLDKTKNIGEFINKFTLPPNQIRFYTPSIKIPYQIFDNQTDNIQETLNNIIQQLKKNKIKIEIGANIEYVDSRLNKKNTISAKYLLTNSNYEIIKYEEY